MADRDCRNNDRKCHAIPEGFWFDEEIEDDDWFDDIDCEKLFGITFFKSGLPRRGLEQDG